MLQIGLIGFGAMGKVHAYAVSNLSAFHSPTPVRARIAGVCCSTPESTARAAEAIGGGVRAYADPFEMIDDPSIGVIDVCTPNPHHYGVLVRAIGAGKHVLCEKPLCPTYEEAARIASLAEEKGICAQVVFHNRFHAPVLRAKQLIGEGRLGRILSFRFSYLHDSCTDPEKPAGWKQTAAMGGGVMNDLGPHAIDLLVHLLGPVETVSGRSQIAFEVRKGPDGKDWKTDADEAFYTLMKMKNGAMGTVEVSKLATGTNDDLAFEIYGTRGALKFSLMDPAWLWFYDRDRKGGELGGERGFTRIECVGRFPAPAGVFPSVKAPVGWLRAHEENAYAFLSSVTRGEKCDPSFAQGAYVQKIIEAAKRSDALAGKEIGVDGI